MHRIWHEEQKMQKFKPMIRNELPYVGSLLVVGLQKLHRIGFVTTPKPTRGTSPKR